jgi:hypothetical protein
MRCTIINEPSDRHSWHDNYLCVPKKSKIRLTWSYNGHPNSKHRSGGSDSASDKSDDMGGSGSSFGRHCVQFKEAAERKYWKDNYLCINESSGYNLKWSSSGRIKGKTCIQIKEGADPDTWDDNYLCW